ncbi:MAG: endonuclease/exonuclease/phosphatase family protein [Thermogemmatispora sp.]|uniref:endonuclease/exonuclease/phosphatase family protein n=1 Tax=Thermogemmatispora sp. TaxID=1968838 RepID=UPI00260F840D|nr:endonuclease/exonuclease/phosphatase family protein [Thermogemmatispora sp.]MBX5457149.1 endonuclease/exonuclease/phosphatase family protein [Thermogemmatispora sp.]
MTRILSYNILAGGLTPCPGEDRRTEPLARLISAVQPDIVGLPEGLNPRRKTEKAVVEELAERLEMTLIRGDHPAAGDEFQVACLTRLPVLASRVHVRPGVLTRPVLEVHVREEDGNELTVFVAHLIASFHKGRAAEHLRQHEIEAILDIMTAARGQPHLLMGDFNALAPGEPLRASALLRYVLYLDQTLPGGESHERDGHPHLAYVLPDRLRPLQPLLAHLSRNRPALWFIDALAGLYVPRKSISLLQRAGYLDCFRHLHPHEPGFTCPALMPAGRIDFIFASPELAPRLRACQVVQEGNGIKGSQASDHLPVLAEFAPCATPAPERETNAPQALAALSSL